LCACLTARRDALFELCDALLCTDGPVRTLVDLALAPEHRRGHGSLYDGLNQGRINVSRLRRALAGMPLPRAADGRIVLAADVSPWLRSDANTCPARSFCHTFGRGEGKHQMVPGWPYSIIAALETGRTSWTAVLDAVRLEPGADVAAVTTVQIRELIERLVATELPRARSRSAANRAAEPLHEAHDHRDGVPACRDPAASMTDGNASCWCCPAARSAAASTPPAQSAFGS
jgi:hypothetical protein